MSEFSIVVKLIKNENEFAFVFIIVLKKKMMNVHVLVFMNVFISIIVYLQLIIIVNENVDGYVNLNEHLVWISSFDVISILVSLNVSFFLSLSIILYPTLSPFSFLF